MTHNVGCFQYSNFNPLFSCLFTLHGLYCQSGGLDGLRRFHALLARAPVIEYTDLEVSPCDVVHNVSLFCWHAFLFLG